jgi:hypothetical protein
MIRDRNTQSWTLKYCLLVHTTLRVFDSHRSSPNDPWAEHEIDPEYTNVNASERRQRQGENEFFIRLHSSSVQFDCWADSAAEKAKWLQALSGERLGMAQPSANQRDQITPGRIAAFAEYYGHLDCQSHGQ